MSSPTPSPDETPPPADEAPPGGAAPRWRLPRRRPEVPDAGVPAPPLDEDEEPAGVAEPPAEGAGRLRRRRRRLLTEREEAVYHLGGLAFELYRRDLLPEGVMRLRAGEVATLDDSVRDIDVRLGEIDRARRERRGAAPEDPSVGCCLVCRTPFRAEARFCWQCGTQVVPPPIGGDDQPTQVISSPGAP